MARKRIVSADLFCGAGGTSTGLLRAAERLGRTVDLAAVNHWDRAIETHAANHPRAAHFCQSLADLDPKKAVPGGKLDLLVASPECFPAGTLILTDDGLVPIEKVQVGDVVFTHAGNWKPVTRVMQTVKDTVVVRGQGHYGIETTAEHPFFSYPNKPPRGVVVTEPFEWTAAVQMNGRYWITPNVAYVGGGPKIPAVGGRGFVFSNLFWWFVGRWIADGCVRIRESNSEITLAIGPAKAESVAEKLNVMAPRGKARATDSELRWRRRSVRTATLFEVGHDGLARWLVENFGRHADGKFLPTWLLTARSEVRRSVLDGYMAGDGYDDGRKMEAQTVSRNLAIGLRLLAESLGHRVQMHRVESKTYEIEGREVNGREAYKLVWVKSPKRVQAFATIACSMSRVKDVQPGRTGVTVYNLSVADDESYVADGLVVHNCTHHSVARGGKPVNDQSRSSAYCVHRWCAALDVKRVLIENVPEFTTWGPLDSKGRPLKSKKGTLFTAFIDTFKAMGYRVEWRVLVAADYGAATTRRRLFIQCAKGRLPIRWPERSHEPDPKPSLVQMLPKWRAAREIIDWTMPGESIFTRKRPLSDNTLKRIEAGLKKFGGVHAEPFLLAMNHMNSRDHDSRYTRDVGLPVPTVTTQGNRFALVEPFVVTSRNGCIGRKIDDPVPTITAGQPAVGVCEPFVMRACNSGDDNCRVKGIDEPVGTIHAGGGSFGLVEPFIMGMSQSGSNGSRLRSTDAPMNTITTADDNAVVTPFILPHRQFDGMQVDDVGDPLRTVTATNGGCNALVQPFIVPQNSSNGPRSVESPAPTLTTTSRGVGLCEPFLVPFYANGGADAVADPLRTVTTRDRHGLVQPDAVRFDIRFRMLQPHELAAAMGFPKGYKITGNRGEQVKQIGNAVCVEQAEALIMAMLEDAA